MPHISIDTDGKDSSDYDMTLADLHRLGRPAAFAGGLLLCAHYGLQLAHGLRTGQILWEAMNTNLGRIDGVEFACAFASIDVALLGIFARLGGDLAGRA